jgi:hypothetical protein
MRKMHLDVCSCLSDASGTPFVGISRAQHEAYVAAAKMQPEARLLLNVAFGEFACFAKYLPEEERKLFEKNYAVRARHLINAIAVNENACRAAGIDLESK